MPAFFAQLRSLNTIAARALEFTILAAVRTGETIGAEAEEFDREEAVWSVPAARMKSGSVHRVPLSERTLRIVEELWPVPGTSYIFRSPMVRKGAPAKPLSNMAMLELLHDLGHKDVTVHGFRSSFRDWAGECTNYPREVAEAALGHTVGDAAERAYRRGDALAKRRKLMDAWARYCEPEKSATIVGIVG